MRCRAGGARGSRLGCPRHPREQRPTAPPTPSRKAHRAAASERFPVLHPITLPSRAQPTTIHAGTWCRSTRVSCRRSSRCSLHWPRSTRAPSASWKTRWERSSATPSYSPTGWSTTPRSHSPVALWPYLHRWAPSCATLAPPRQHSERSIDLALMLFRVRPELLLGTRAHASKQGPSVLASPRLRLRQIR